MSHVKDLITLHLHWLAADGGLLLEERRTLTRTVLDERTWRLDIQTRLTAVVDVSLGSPGSMAPRAAATAASSGDSLSIPPPRLHLHSRGEPAVHGSVAPWLAWTGEFDGGPATLVFGAPQSRRTRGSCDAASYPAVGSALAWDTAVELAEGESLTRTNTVWISDGALDVATIEGLVGGEM
jgi:hypothetical protein